MWRLYVNACRAVLKCARASRRFCYKSRNGHACDDAVALRECECLRRYIVFVFGDNSIRYLIFVSPNPNCNAE